MLTVKLTNSQRMALIDIIVEQMRNPEATEVFIDCSESPAVETRPGDLIRLLSELTASAIAQPDGCGS